MKKVLFFINSLTYGGAEKVLVNLVNNLDREKYEITLLVLFDGGVNKQYLKKEIYYKYVFKKTWRGNTHILKIFSPEFLYKRFIKDDYDIVISYLEGLTARILSACPNPKTKKISWQHLGVLNKKQLVYPVFRSFDEVQEVYNKFDAIVGVSETVIQSFSEVTGIKNNLYVKYNTNETEKIQHLAREAITDSLFDSSKINLVSVGRLNEQKGYDRLFKVIKRLVYEEPLLLNKFHLYILGQGECERSLMKYINEEKIADYITLLGYKSNPYKYVKNSDLFVCSSYNEGFSTAVTEALIVGTPVITTLCSGMVELLGEKNQYGIIVDNSSEGLYKGLKNILFDIKKLKFYKEQAKTRGKFFSREATVQAVEELLDNI